MWRTGVDIGGTFTDIVFLNEESGELKVLKVLTTPRKPSEAVLSGLEGSGVGLGEVSTLVHATTLGTNMFLGQEGLEPPKVALITTKGFRDVLEIGRQRRPELYNLFFEKPPPLIRRRDRYEVEERVDAWGNVVIPLNREEAIRLAETICRRGYEVVAISFLHSYMNPEHEEEMERLLRERCPELDVILSSRVNPEHKEYERTSTTVVNAFLRKLLSSYLTNLERELRDRGFEGRLLVMQSSGGVSKVEYAIERPAAFIESGPAAGAVAVAHYSRLTGDERVISFDMGGTTAKAATVVGGEPAVTTEYEVGGKVHAGRLVKGSGYPVRYPFIDLAEVSAGGGTIAWIDEGGALRVGPVSAGAEPGPACYGRGGKRATITDANFLLGRLGSELAGGSLILRRELAEKAIGSLAVELGLEMEEAAMGIIKLANTIMAKALRIVTVERGHDPRDFVMYVFGGAGPLHGVELARELEAREVLVPVHPGVFSAFGLLLTDYRVDSAISVMKLAEELDEEDVEEAISRLRVEAARELEGVDEVNALPSLDMRYSGQAYYLNIPWRGSIDLAIRDFHAKHGRMYGFSSPEEPVEVVNVRLTLIGSMRKPSFPRRRAEEHRPEPEAARDVYFEGEGWMRTAIHKRERLRPGAVVDGPAVVEEYDSTTLVPPGHVLRVDEFGNLRIGVMT